MEFNQVLNQRKSIRRFKDKQVERTLIDQMIESAILAPSWKNSQTARYYVIESKELLTTFKEDCLAKFNHDNCKDAPIIIVSTFVENIAGFSKDGAPNNELSNEWGSYDLGLHNQNLILKATELGLDTLIMGIRDASKIKEMLNIADNEIIVPVIAVGYGDIDPQRPKRKEIEEIVKYY